MIEQLIKIWQRRELLFYLVKYEMKAENRNKVLGFLWSFLDPLLLLLVYIVLVVYIFQRGEPQFPVLLFSALLSWRWFTNSLGQSVTSIPSKVGLVRTVSFPLAILPITSVTIGLFDWLFGFAILIPMLFIFEAKLTVHVLWLPLLLFLQLLGTIGASLILAVVGTHLSDLRNIIQFILRLWFFLSPIIYSVEARIPERFQTWYMLLNPFGGLLESYKNILVRGSPPSEYVAVAATLAVIVFVLGLRYFNHDEKKLVKAI